MANLLSPGGTVVHGDQFAPLSTERHMRDWLQPMTQSPRRSVAMLPAMRAAGSGTLLFTTGAGSIEPVTMLGNVNSAAAALRNWAINPNHELADTGVYAAHLAIGVSIDLPTIPGVPTAPAADIAASYWDLHAKRTDAEYLFTR